MTESHNVVVLGPGEGEALWCAGALTTVKVSGPETGGAYAMIEDLAPQGAVVPLHVHPHDDEAFYVIAGDLTFKIGEHPPYHARAGSFVLVPGGVTHGFEVTSPTARYLIITTPRHVQFYRAIGSAAPERVIPPDMPMDMDRLGAACEAFDVIPVAGNLG